MRYFYIIIPLALILGVFLFFRINTLPSGFSLAYDNGVSKYMILNQSDRICTNPLGYSHPGSLLEYHNERGEVVKLCTDKGAVVIDSYIKKIVFDQKYILIKQKPLNVICQCDERCLNHVIFNNKSYKECVNAFQRSNLYQYWIIQRQDNIIYGPFSKDYYKRMEIELNISQNIQLLMKRIN